MSKIFTQKIQVNNCEGYSINSYDDSVSVIISPGNFLSFSNDLGNKLIDKDDFRKWMQNINVAEGKCSVVFDIPYFAKSEVIKDTFADKRIYEVLSDGFIDEFYEILKTLATSRHITRLLAEGYAQNIEYLISASLLKSQNNEEMYKILDADDYSIIECYLNALKTYGDMTLNMPDMVSGRKWNNLATHARSGYYSYKQIIAFNGKFDYFEALSLMVHRIKVMKGNVMSSREFINALPEEIDYSNIKMELSAYDTNNAYSMQDYIVWASLLTNISVDNMIRIIHIYGNNFGYGESDVIEALATLAEFYRDPSLKYMLEEEYGVGFFDNIGLMTNRLVNGSGEKSIFDLVDDCIEYNKEQSDTNLDNEIKIFHHRYASILEEEISGFKFVVPKNRDDFIMFTGLAKYRYYDCKSQKAVFMLNEVGFPIWCIEFSYLLSEPGLKVEFDHCLSSCKSKQIDDIRCQWEKRIKTIVCPM